MWTVLPLANVSVKTPFVAVIVRFTQVPGLRSPSPPVRLSQMTSTGPV